MAVVRIYEIASADLQKVKAILERAETDPELAKVMKDREKAAAGLAKAKKKKDHAAFGQVQAAEDALKAADEKIEQMKKEGKLKINEWARNGFTLRGAKGVGLEGEQSYLYVKAPDEDFFARNEKEILDAGAKPLTDETFEKVRTAFESEEESSAAGMGFVFK